MTSNVAAAVAFMDQPLNCRACGAPISLMIVDDVWALVNLLAAEIAEIAEHAEGLVASASREAYLGPWRGDRGARRGSGVVGIS